MIEAIILAAGESQRMGRLKPLIKIENRTFLRHIVDQCRKAAIAQIHIVVGFEADKIIRACGCDANFIRNSNYKAGQFSSLQCGIRSLGKECQAAVVCLGDQPHIRSTWIKSLIDTYEKTGAAIVIPRYDSRHGHPVLYSSQTFDIILTMNSSLTARDVTKRLSNSIEYVCIKDDGILTDADTREELKQIIKRMPKRS
jgi:molybdenum cofactor cytidylyltransferase